MSGRCLAPGGEDGIIEEVSGKWYRSVLFRFYLVGGASAFAYVALFVLLRFVMPSQVANVLALLISAIANTAVNRRFTFGIRGTDEIMRHYLQGLAVFALGLALTGGALWLLHIWTADPSRVQEVAVLVAANLVATVVRFLGLRRVFAPKASDEPRPGHVVGPG
ncbi:GtrA family protein [Williamsia sp. 1138]|uniref:GtrA family protein n=1 Tax=Williamsia sp. 1138 TaxID=1903117 RepID=UPI001AEF8ACE|nr:GtrA family protein [Williamsia sp. 1138]